ncbi:MAG: hypothetical protein Q7U36_03130 [bacterium]|nr:hypothetical protein [bacterium]
MNLYLDIDGVILTKEGQEAKHLFEFLDFATEKFDCYWLTTHCKGDGETALEYLEKKISTKSFDLLKKIEPTNWDLWKTEVINFDEDFLWLDDYIFDGEMEILKKNNASQKLIKIDLKNNPDQLLEIIKLK